SEAVLQMPMTGRPSKRSAGRPWFFIQLRCMKAFLPGPPNHALERSFRGASAMPIIPFLVWYGKNVFADATLGRAPKTSQCAVKESPALEDDRAQGCHALPTGGRALSGPEPGPRHQPPGADRRARARGRAADRPRPRPAAFEGGDLCDPADAAG